MLQLYVTKIYLSAKYILSVVTSYIIFIADCNDNIFLKTPQGLEAEERNWKLEFQNIFSSEREECHMNRVGSKYHLNIWQMQKKIQIYQLHVEFQELNWCKKRNSNTTNSREKCNHLRYLIPRSICNVEEKIENAWMSKPARAGEKACPFWDSRRR